jgi:hypothetical protein
VSLANDILALDALHAATAIKAFKVSAVPVLDLNRFKSVAPVSLKSDE